MKRLLTLPSARLRLDRMQLVAPAAAWRPRTEPVDVNLPRFLPHPVFFGDRPAVPMTAARPILSDGGDASKLVVAVKTFGRGPLQLSNLRLGDRVIVSGRLKTRSIVSIKGSEFGDFSYECVEGRAGDEGLSLFPLVIRREALDIKIPRSTAGGTDDYARQSTEPGTTMFDVVISFPGGLSQATTTKGVTTYSPLICKLRIAAWAVGSSTPTIVRKVDVQGFPDAAGFEWRIPYVFIGNAATWKVGIQINGFVNDRGQAVSPSPSPSVRWSELTSRGKASIAGAQNHALIAVAGNLTLLGTDEFLSNLNADAIAELAETVGGTPVATRSPAAAFIDVLQGEGNPDPIPDARMDTTVLTAWKNAAATDGLSFDFQFGTDGGAGDIDSALRMIAAAGKARYIVRDGKYSVIREPSGDPVGLFCPANMRPGFRIIREAFGGAIHGIRCSMENRGKAFVQESFIVYADGYSSANASRFEDWTFDGTTERSTVKGLAAYHLSVLATRSLMYEFPVDINHLRVMRGDLVSVAHYRIRKGTSWGRVWRTPTAKRLELSRECPMNAGTTYRLLLQRASGVQAYRQVVTIPSAGKVIDTAVDHGAAEGDLFVFGELSEEAELCVVLKVDHESELQATITVAPQGATETAGMATIFVAHPPTDPTVTINSTNGSLGFGVKT